MAVRTDESAVKALLAPGEDYDLVNNPSLTGFIATASAIVDRVETCAIAKGKALAANELELIERWLSAHFYQASDQALASKSNTGAGGSFQGQTGMGIEGTKYGQTALTLDFSGCLNMINKRQSASLGWLGKRPSEQTDYVDRD